MRPAELQTLISPLFVSPPTGDQWSQCCSDTAVINDESEAYQNDNNDPEQQSEMSKHLFDEIDKMTASFNQAVNNSSFRMYPKGI